MEKPESAWVASAQGQRLLAYGGERARAAVGDTPAEDEEEEDTETVGDAALLDMDAQLWVPMTLAGECEKLVASTK